VARENKKIANFRFIKETKRNFSSGRAQSGPVEAGMDLLHPLPIPAQHAHMHYCKGNNYPEG
jgi:hypothetical protein